MKRRPQKSIRISLVAGAIATATFLSGATTPALADSDNSEKENSERPTAVAGPITVSGFATPESVLYDQANDVYLVSNINGGGLDPDNNGFISRVSPAGAILNLKWIAGGVNGVQLDAPKGSAISRGLLYVADINNLRIFDLATGNAVGSINFPDATFLNDVAADNKGNVYVSDIGFQATPSFPSPSGTDAIYKVAPNRSVSVVAAGAYLNHPNGLAVLEDNKLQVVSFDPFGGTKEIYVIDKNGRKSNIVPMPAGLLDGVVIVGERVLVSSWESSSVYSVGENGRVSVVATNLPSPADIGYDKKRKNLLVPLFNDNKIVIQQLPRRGD